MQNKLAHAAERKAFSVVLDKAIDAVRGDHPEEAIEKFLDMGQKMLSGTAPDMAKSLREAFYPGSKWENMVIDMARRIDPHILHTALLNGAYESAFRGLRETTISAQKNQCNVPWIIIFDPTSACNMHCVGCWAADYSKSLNLTFDEMDSLVKQANDLGCHWFFMTGGEPMVRWKDIVKLAEKHNDSLFSLYTNGTLINQQVCDDCKRLGNVLFSVSLEGSKEANDGRRGEGDYDKVMAAFDLMKANGIPFGVSTAYTRANVEAVTSDEYYDMLIEKGALWAWYFHYMPVGEGANADLMPTVEQREYMFNRIRWVRSVGDEGYPIFAMDFQNDGEFVGGCIAGGRVYCHVNARGDVEPCVFIHYSNANFKESGNWLECLHQPIFQAYRAHYPWNDNLLEPCPMLENSGLLTQIVDEADAKCTEYVTPESAADVCARTKPYAEAWAPKAEELWLNMYPDGKKHYEDAMSQEKISVKAKVIAEEDAQNEAVVD